MRTKKQSTPKQSYSAREVADMIGVELWRVKNFIGGKPYSLAPSGGGGKWGHFTIEDVFRFALANHLVGFGFAPTAVGLAVKAVPVEVWRRKDFWAKAPLVLCSVGPEDWRLTTVTDAVLALIPTNGGGEYGVFALNLTRFLDSLLQDRIQPYLFGAFKPGPAPVRTRDRGSEPGQPDTRRPDASGKKPSKGGTR